MSTTPPAGFAPRLQPPYYAVIFTSRRTPGDHGYGEMAEHMAALAAGQPGYLGVESVRDAEGLGITVAYWRSQEDIAAWRRHTEHVAARDQGRARWYAHYEVRVAKVERAYGWDAGSDAPDDPVKG